MLIDLKNAKPTTKGKISISSKTDQHKIQDELKEKTKNIGKSKKSESNLVVNNSKVLITKVKSSPPVTVPKRTTALKNTTESIGKLKSTTSKAVSRKEAVIPSQLISKTRTANKNNVMSTTTNVTVSSPPSSASKGRSVSLGLTEEQPKSRERTRTRTIAPEESILIKRDIAMEKELPKELKPNEVVKPKELVKDPIAFEIKFEEAKKLLTSKEIEMDEDYDYESDFESYESDFEDEPDEETISDKTDNSNDEYEEIVESERTRIDSGNYDLSTKKSIVTPIGQPDSIEDTINSHDSGISYDDQNKRVTSPKAQAYYKRGQELMKKITFDEMTFKLFEMKPIRYDVFMQLYGQTHTEQTFTQTESQVTDEEVQTDRVSESHMWTQYPATFSKNGLIEIGSKQYNEEKHGVGDGDGDEEIKVKSLKNIDPPGLEHSLIMLNNFFKTDDSIKIVGSSQNITDFKNLTKFLQNAAFTISHIVDKKTNSQELSPSKMDISRGMFSIKFNQIESLKNTIVTKLYTNLCLNNVLLTIHKHMDIYKDLICQWNILYAKSPLKIFSSWSGIECLEIHPEMSDFIVAGCNDGTIALWDMRESTVQQEENTSTFIMPCEVVSLSESINNFSLTNTVAIKAIPEKQLKQSGALFTQSHASQICSLHENGTITIWTILMSSTAMQDENLDGKRMYFLKPGSHVKLVKNLIIDLNPSPIEKLPDVRKSSFEKTRYYFENDLFDDKVLRELQKIDTTKVSQKDKLVRDEYQRFCDFEVDYKEFLVTTDSNYVLGKSRINFNAKERKIGIVEDSIAISPTSLKTHPIDKAILAVGLSNGNLLFVNNRNENEDQKHLKRQLSNESNKNTSNDRTVDNILSKSCAIQNIVENERKTFEEMDELKTFLINEAISEQVQEKCNEHLTNLRIQFDKSIFNTFNLSCSVKLIEFTKNGKLMFLLVGKKVKVFNCWSGFEMSNEDETDYKDIKCAQSGDDANYLVSILRLS